ncbi:hypothetical protein EV667_2187 [Ancylobacter aquaticus]|uniref:Holin (3TMs family) n=1 Tax=Ancylobacter aquaticus TaxID=100 RepID=A0A4R1I0G8_ANCAQ|nr:hypothetical protein [Ancylobacter aquaticus]TCK28188.1 hypothetical protein EV667_2187 [Ancylobacter aquaticus]
MGWLWKLATWALSFASSGAVGRVLDTFDKRTDAQTEKERMHTEVTKEAIRAEVEAQKAGREILIAEQGRWYTAIIRPLFALPFVIYIWKLVVWDKVLSLGATDPLSTQLSDIMLTVIGAFFIGRTTEKVVDRIMSGRGR